MEGYVVAVDVGTGSARAGVFDRKGHCLSRASHPIRVNREDAVMAEHSSDDIWSAVVACVRAALVSAGIDCGAVAAIGFDATCSLVFLDSAGKPVSVAKDGEPRWDTIAWFDHRAAAQAEALSRIASDAVRHSGGVVSPEMQIPKLMWIRDNLSSAWEKTGIILDLADYLTFRSTGSLRRSACTLTAKWCYLNHQQRWDQDFLAAAGLVDLEAKARIEGPPSPVGTAIATLSPEAAAAFGLRQDCIVAAGMVDAYAGVLALSGPDPEVGDRVSLIGGTSSCVMRFLDRPHYLHSYWGPYFGAALPDRWIVEGGQSAAGALLDLVVRNHLGREPTVADHERLVSRSEELYRQSGPSLGAHIHVLPDFHGNRTPIGNAGMKGVIHGLSLDASFDGLAILYYRTKLGLALGIRQVIDAMEAETGPVRTLVLGGGHARSRLFRELYANATGRELILSAGDEAMLLGTAMAAATAAGWHGSLAEACKALKRREQVIAPDPRAARHYARDYAILLRMQDHRAEISAM